MSFECKRLVFEKHTLCCSICLLNVCSWILSRIFMTIVNIIQPLLAYNYVENRVHELHKLLTYFREHHHFFHLIIMGMIIASVARPLSIISLRIFFF